MEFRHIGRRKTELWDDNHDNVYMELQSQRLISDDVVSTNYPSIDNEECRKLCDEFSDHTNQPNKAEAPSEESSGDPSRESVKMKMKKVAQQDKFSDRLILLILLLLIQLSVDRVEYLQNLHQGFSERTKLLDL